MTCRARLLLDSVDGWLLQDERQLIDESRREVIPVLVQRQGLADNLAKCLKMLGPTALRPSIPRNPQMFSTRRAGNGLRRSRGFGG